MSTVLGTEVEMGTVLGRIGYGDITATTKEERTMAIFVMVVGSAFFAWSTARSRPDAPVEKGVQRQDNGDADGPVRLHHALPGQSAMRLRLHSRTSTDLGRGVVQDKMEELQVRDAICLRARLAMSGTEIAYGMLSGLHGL
eukprot:3562492-Rhodomonas_salina.3